jgi:putative intracellular protease/amidase
MKRVMHAFAVTVTLGLAATTACAGQVLVVLSDEDHLDLKDGKAMATGFYLNELMEPVKLLLDAGHKVTFATPNGKAPAVDASSIDVSYFGKDAAALQIHRALLDNLELTSKDRSPVVSLERVEQIGYGRFDAVYIPGGHAPMQDLLKSSTLGRLLVDFHKQGKPTALVCHGPIALLSTLPDAKGFVSALEAGRAPARADWTYSGYKVAVITDREEELAKPLLKGGEMKFYPQAALQEAGARLSVGVAPWTANVVVDREVITGQNPASALAVGQLLLERLK